MWLLQHLNMLEPGAIYLSVSLIKKDSTVTSSWSSIHQTPASLIFHTAPSRIGHSMKDALTVHLFHKQFTSLNRKQAFKLLSTHHQNLEWKTTSFIDFRGIWIYCTAEILHIQGENQVLFSRKLLFQADWTWHTKKKTGWTWGCTYSMYYIPAYIYTHTYHCICLIDDS